MIFFTGGMTTLRGVRVMAGLGAAVLLSGLTGCSLGTMQLSGTEPVASVSVNMNGTVHGGQQAVKGAKVQLWAVGSGSYGAAAHELTSTSTTNYHPGGATGCSTTPASITAIASASSVVTVTAANTLIAGDYVTFSGLSTPLGQAMDNAGGTFVVLSATASSFTANRSGFSYADTTTAADSGTSVATCYSSVVTDYSGNFTLTGDYACGSYSASNVYITATGGNPGLVQGTNNTASKMVALLYAAPASSGAPVAMTCSSLGSSTLTIVNEVTTAAAAFALAQYYGNGGFGGPSTAQGAIGFSNAFLTAGLLANSSTGNAITSTTLTGSGGTVVATPDPNKLYTIADILAACVNSAGGSAGDNSNCGTLFADAVPTGGAAISDTLAAAVELNLNPISNNTNGSATNLTALYGLAQGTGAPYPTVSSQPTDWTVGINYTSSSALLFSKPLDLAVDSGGNIWVINNPGSANNSLSEINPIGVAQYTSVLTSGSATYASDNPRNLAIDTNNNIWSTTSSGSGYIFEYTPSNGTIATFAGNKASYGIAIDGNNDVFVSEESGTAPPNSYLEFTNGVLAATNEVEFADEVSVLQPEYLAIDTSGNLWATEGSVNTAETQLQQVTGITAGVAACTSYPCTITGVTYNTVTTGSTDEPYGLAADNNSMWVANVSGNSVTDFALSGATITASNNYAPTGGFKAPSYVAVDGAQNIWVANKNTGTAPLGGTVSEISSAGVLLSETPISPATSPLGFVHVGLSSGQGIGVDPSGNVWIANNSTTAGVEEIVGAATPVITPIAASLAYKTTNPTSTFPAKP